MTISEADLLAELTRSARADRHVFAVVEGEVKVEIEGQAPFTATRGSLVNINLDDASDITHFNIEKIGRLHDQTITRIMAIMGSRRAPATPAAAQPAHAASPASAPSNAN